ncbi:MAG: diadenylate cyclase [Candidatus Methanoperedens sp.]|jgi:DNA integrity scanning protein DisA with diadenylate cyclase activity|nr:diadenylate cyclase [Candidatus Methanoperedens sp.]
MSGKKHHKGDKHHKTKSSKSIIKKTGKRDISIITKSAVKIAEKLNASVIIIFSEKLPEISTHIPVLVFTGRKLAMVNQFSRYIDDSDKTLYEKMEDRTRSEVRDISDASVIAFINNLLEVEGLVVGIISMKDNDSIIVYDLSTNDVIKQLRECTERADTRVIKAILNIALEIAMQGREGKMFGTGFIIGDSDEVMRRSHQLVLNPFEGQPEENCDIVNPESWETVKSFAQLDGVFVVTESGEIKAAGRYLDINARDVPVEKGLGGRHASAAAITRDTETIAITVSSSGGIIRVFKDALEIIKIEPDIMMVQ